MIAYTNKIKKSQFANIRPSDSDHSESRRYILAGSKADSVIHVGTVLGDTALQIKSQLLTY